MQTPSPDPNAKWSDTSAARILCPTRRKFCGEPLPLQAPAVLCGSVSGDPTPPGIPRTRAHDPPPPPCRARQVLPGNKLSNLPTGNSFRASHFHGSQGLFQEVERGIQAGFHSRDRTRKNLRHLLELESLIDLQQHGFTLIVGQPA